MVRWLDSLDPNSVHLSALTVGDIRKGVEKLPSSRRKETIHRWLSEDLLLRFEGRILSLDAGAALSWGVLTGRIEKAGRTMPAVDSLIAALALHHNLVLATRSVDDFQDAGVEILNRWE